MQAGSGPPTGLASSVQRTMILGWNKCSLCLSLCFFQISKQQLQTVKDRFQAFLNGETQIVADEAFMNAVQSYYEVRLREERWRDCSGLHPQWEQQPWPSIGPLLLRQSGGWVVTVLRNNCILFGENCKRSNCLPADFYTQPCDECWTCNFLLNPYSSLQS